MAIPLARAGAPPSELGAVVVPRRASKDWGHKLLGEDWAWGLLFAAPMLALLVGLIGWPMLQAAWMSFWQVIGPRWVAFVGWGNYRTTLQDPVFRRSLGVTIQYTAESIAFKFLIGLTAALALH